MKQVISVKDVQEMVLSGKDPHSLPADALLTPSARDYLRELEGPGAYKPAAGISTLPTAEPNPVTSKSPKQEIDSFFNSPRIEELKRQLCDIGKRLWQRA